MYGVLKAAMFRLDPERAHRLAMVALRRAQRGGLAAAALAAPPPDARLATETLGIRFATPLGMAAGFDKEAECYNALLRMGFGHVEVGTVTPEPQEGNPKPRIHRLPQQEALVNSMGFPGPGFVAVARHLERTRPIGPVGLNIGPNKDASRDESMRALSRMAAAAPADYVALNVSSPNTPGLRLLQEPRAVASLVGDIREAMDDAENRAPLLVKLHPDAGSEDLIQVARAATDAGAAGIIAVNSTMERAARPAADAAADLPGGLSGRPLFGRALAHVTALANALDVPIIGVGGVSTGADCLRMLQAGASLVQAYTGFVYRGPRFAHLVNQELVAAMDDAGVDSVMDLESA